MQPRALVTVVVVGLGEVEALKVVEGLEQIDERAWAAFVATASTNRG